MGAPKTRFSPSRHYLFAGLTSVALSAYAGWFAAEWVVALVASAFFLATSAVILWFAFRPPIEITDKHLKIGRRTMNWSEIRRVDRTGWISPMVVYLALAGGKRILLVYPGDLASANNLLRQLRRCSREALIDGVPHRQFWGEGDPPAQPCTLPSPKYRVLSSNDEAEVERLYQLLKTVGHLDPKNSTDEK